MGRFHCSGYHLIGWIGEIIGYKSGLALTEAQIRDFLNQEEGFADVLPVDLTRMISLRGEEFEDIIRWLLYCVGSIDDPNSMPPLFRVTSKFKHNQKLFQDATRISELFVQFLNTSLERRPSDGSRLDPTNFLLDASRRYGEFGLQVGVKLIESFNLNLFTSPWGRIRNIEWKDIAKLDDLFKKEGLKTHHGDYFDQRFINYLHRNFDHIDRVNWRKFEGLAAEFLHNAGLHVEIGPGRNDGGIDIRAWTESEHAGVPPAILVQCKRQADKVERVIVKALWADIQHENASSGLIVTTSALSPGAEADCRARGYPIFQANRSSLKKWIEALRIPWTGVFLAE